MVSARIAAGWPGTDYGGTDHEATGHEATGNQKKTAASVPRCGGCNGTYASRGQWMLAQIFRLAA